MKRIKLSYLHLIFIIIAVLLVISIPWITNDKLLGIQFDDNFTEKHILSIPLGMQGDLVELLGLSNSLNNHLLPYWDLEYANKFGYPLIDPPIHAFMIHFLLLFLGNSATLIILNTFLILFANYYIAWKITLNNFEKRKQNAFIFLLPILFLTHVFVILSNKEYLITLCDHIHLMTFFLLGQLYFLINKQTSLSLLFATLAFLTKYEAFVFSLFGTILYYQIFKIDSRQIYQYLKKYILLIIPYILLIILINLINGDLFTSIEAFIVERFARIDYLGILDKVFPQSASLWESFSLSSTFNFLKQFIMGSMLMGLFLFFPQKDKVSNLFRIISLFYLFLILASKVKRLHYISPLIFFTTIVGLRTIMTITFNFKKKLSIFK